MIYLKRNGVADIPSEAHDIGLFDSTFQSVTTSYHWTFILWIYTFYTLAMGPQNPGVAPQAAIFQWELTHLHNTVALDLFRRCYNPQTPRAK